MKKKESRNQNKIKVKKAIEKVVKKGYKTRLNQGLKWLVGIDEVGRGPLAGPVAVCACVMPYHKSPEESYKNFLRKYQKDIKLNGLRDLSGKDSKKLKENEREVWMNLLSRISKEKSDSEAQDKIHFLYGEMSAKQIDKIGISICIKNLIKKHLTFFDEKLYKAAEAMILLDGGLKAPAHFQNQKTIIKGDEKELVISLASIYAKVSRDSYMKKISKKYKYSSYLLAKHKGYGTKDHLEKIRLHGISDIHRKTFCKLLLKS